MDLLDIQNGAWNKDDARFTVAIIGGGFAGATLAAQILRQSENSVSVTLIERAALPGRGIAYGTQFDGHLLNVRAQNMSAYPESPDHFVRWAQLNYDSSVKPIDFLPRRVYGQYVLSLLQEESRSNPGRFRCFQDEADALARAGAVAMIHLRSGRTVLADKVVLTLGNFPPAKLSLPGKTSASSRYISDPWRSNRSSYIDGRSVLLVGSGLTAVDVAIELRAWGFEGTIHMLSRHGLLPQTHKSAVPVPLFWNNKSPRTVRGLLRVIRAEIRNASARGSNWRAVIDSMRPVTQEIWCSLPEAEKRRFLRHARAYWEVHRHRVAPQIGAQLDAQVLSGEIQNHAGRITAYDEDSDGVTVRYRSRKGGEIVRLRVDRVINCTGPESDIRRVGSPLLASLLQQKLICTDALSLGLMVSHEGAMIDADGEPSNFLYTAGSSRKGTLWETTAVPEIRSQVRDLAGLLAEPDRKDPECAGLEPVAAGLSGL